MQGQAAGQAPCCVGVPRETGRYAGKAMGAQPQRCGQPAVARRGLPPRAGQLLFRLKGWRDYGDDHRRAETVGAQPQRCGQCGELFGDVRAQCSERGLGLEPRAHRAHLGDTPGELLGEQPDDDAQDMMDEADPALDPAHRPRELDRVAAQLIGRGGQARGLLGVGHHRFELVQLARKPCGQTVRQQAEGGVAFAAIPARNLCPARGLACVSPVTCQRTPPVRVVRAVLEPCIAPRLGPNPTSTVWGSHVR